MITSIIITSNAATNDLGVLSLQDFQQMCQAFWCCCCRSLQLACEFWHWLWSAFKRLQRQLGVELQQTSPPKKNNKNLMFFFSSLPSNSDKSQTFKYLKNISCLKHLVNWLLSRQMKVRSWKTMDLAILTPNAQWHIVMPTFQACPRSQICLSCSSFFLWPEKETCHPRNHQ